jgi:methylthioribose-1-phosphate isomerase
MVVRGAPAIGCTAAYGLAVEALRLRHLAPPEFLAQLSQLEGRGGLEGA